MADARRRDPPEGQDNGVRGPATNGVASARGPGNPPRSLVESAARVLRAADQPARAAFLARALNALARLAPRLEERALGDAAGALSDYAALLSALEQPDALGALQAEDLLATARVRGLRARAHLLAAEGGTLSVEAAANLLGVTRQAINKRRRAGRLLALSTGRHGYAYPAWQFGANSVLPGLEEVLADLHEHDPWTQAGFFLNGSLDLDGAAPLGELRRGNIAAVRRAAQRYGEQGAP